MSKLVVYGGAGALGRALVQHFKSKGYVKYFREKKLKGELLRYRVSQSCTHDTFYNYTIRP